MTVTFLTNFVHHHQLPVADELYRLLGNNYHYIATEPLSDSLITGGYDPSLDRPYVIRSYESENSMIKAFSLVDKSDVVIVGSAPNSWVYKRKCDNKITFHYNERWLKLQPWKVFLPHSLWRIYKHHYKFRNSRCYMLCASAFTARDVNKFGCYLSKCFKWGYMTAVEQLNINRLFKSNEKFLRLMWCGRFITWKHPEMPIKLAYRLKKKGYMFTIDMYGSGVLLEKMKFLSKKLKLDDCIVFKGNMPNDQILIEMRTHDIFLFTSDYNEGWGAVANEAMSNGCALVGSSDIGSIPYLVNDGVNGLIFRSCNLNSLENKVVSLFENRLLLESIKKEGLITLQNIWSPRNAAVNLINLIYHILDQRLDDYSLTEGPGSWA